ncbi:MAG: VOC family protein [Acidihalobacter sp.]|jgi:uncharacterized protein|uniref:VOC family protein n=1 Tax=Acidihalobacter sp. TaxID=1872108 RepID=UPI00307DAE87
MKNVINWFEIPAADFGRAIKFYETVFGTTLRLEDMSGAKMGIFPYEAPATSGAVAQMPELKPGNTGTLIYLDASPDIGMVLSRVGTAGGTVVLEKTLINDDIGYIGIFIDTEGNRIGVHAAK